MDVTLPSGHIAKFRDRMMRGDIRECRRGMVFITNADGSRRTDGAFLDDLTGRVIARMMIDWDLPGMPRLGDAQGERQQQILDMLDEDDALALEMAVGPWVDRILKMNRGVYAFSHTSSGVRVEVTDPEQAAKLSASGDFTVLESPDPKLKSLATGTSTPASPAPSGPEGTTDPTP